MPAAHRAAPALRCIAAALAALAALTAGPSDGGLAAAPELKHRAMVVVPARSTELKNAIDGAPRLRHLAAVVAPGVVRPAQETPAPEQLRLDIDRLREQIAALEARLSVIGEQRETVVDEFAAADVQLALSRRQLELIRLRMQVLSRQSDDRQAAVERLGEQLGAARTELAERIVALYRMGPLSYARFLLAADEPEEVLANYQIVGRLASRDRAAVANLAARRDAHQRAVESMRQTVRDWQAARAEETLAVETLTARQARRGELIRRIDVEVAAGRQALAEREESAAALEDLLDEVDSEPLVVAAGAAPPAFAAARGRLPWPATGPITENFGRRVHPVYDTVTLFKGIEIDAAAGTSVRTVFAGRVVFADWFQSYGMVVIVDHGDDYFTTYGHLGSIDVRAAESVAAGAVLGSVGDTGSLIGPSLYFEVREGSAAVDPAGWLQRR